MAIICPFADWRPLPEATSQPKITPRTVIYHTAVGTLRGVENYFKTRTGVESHFMIGGPWDGSALDGAIWQWMDLGRQADANLDANSFAISIEFSDNAPQSASDLAPYSAKQVTSAIRLGSWLCDRFDIPRRQCPAWNAGGLGWHAMWGAPSHWTPARGKVCPGAKRIAQLKNTIFPAIISGRPPEEEDLTEAEHDALMWLRQNATLLRDEGVRMTAQGDPTVPAGRETNNIANILARLDAIEAKLPATP